MNEPPVVLDASALLAMLQGEAGAEYVVRILPGCLISAVNLSEVVAKLSDHGIPAEQTREMLDGLPIDVRPFDREGALAAGNLRHGTRRAGLSLGDRACLALAKQLDGVAVTADRAWASLAKSVKVRVTVIR